MPRFYFDVHDGRRAVDTVGRTLTDAAEARTQALKEAGAFVSDPRILTEGAGAIHVVVRDETGHTKIQLRLAVIIEDS